MRRATVGVIGHVDHGKTALVHALTGTDTDRLPEEKARGISITLGFAHLSGVDRDADDRLMVDLIDMPGHERFVRTMIAGATGIDAVLLAVAADGGIMPQTIEHTDIAAMLGVSQAVTVVTRCDLATAYQAGRVAQDAADLLASRGIALAGDAPVLASARSGRGIADIRDTLLALAGQRKPRAVDGNVWLPIDRAFVIDGHGPVVTGTLRSGVITVGDKLQLQPSGAAVRVRSIQVHGKTVASALSGERAAINLRDVTRADLARGMALATPGTLSASEWMTISIATVPDAPALSNGARLRVFIGAGETDARLRLLESEKIGPGESAIAQLRLAEPVAVPSREHLVLRVASPARTVAGGRIIEAATHRRRRMDAARLVRLRSLRDLPPDEAIGFEVSWRGATGARLDTLARLTALPTHRIEDALLRTDAVRVRGGHIYARNSFDTLCTRIPDLLAHHPAGLTTNQLLSALDQTRAGLLDAALEALLADGVLAARGGLFALPDPAGDAARADSEAEQEAAVAEMLRASGLSPPNPSAITVDPDLRRAIDRLLRTGMLIRAVDRAKKRDMIFHRDAIDEAMRCLAPLLATSGGLPVSTIGAALGISRKFTMPLLDHLDTIRFTQRVGDLRILHDCAPLDRTLTALAHNDDP